MASNRKIIKVPILEKDLYETKLQDLTEQLTAAKGIARRLRKKEMLFQSIMDANRSLFKPLGKLPSTYKAKRGQDVDTEAMVLHISDSHMDRIVTPASVQGLENYNFPEAVCRAENLVDGFLKIKNEKLNGYDFPVLYILMYGDNTNGTTHDYEDKSAFKNEIKNCFAISNVYALMLRDICPQFGKVVCICLPGNHGRTTVKKDYEEPHNSWDYMVYESTKELCRDIPNVEFRIPNSYTAIVNIEGWNFFIEHGDDIKAWNGIPYYGVERKTRRIMSLHASNKLFISYYVLGHFHGAANLPMLGNAETLVNGAWYETDPFALSLGYSTVPAQWMHGVSKSRGITFRYKIWPKEKIKRKPGRYAKVLTMFE